MEQLGQSVAPHRNRNLFCATKMATNSVREKRPPRFEHAPLGFEAERHVHSGTIARPGRRTRRRFDLL